MKHLSNSPVKIFMLLSLAMLMVACAGIRKIDNSYTPTDEYENVAHEKLTFAKDKTWKFEKVVISETGSFAYVTMYRGKYNIKKGNLTLSLLNHYEAYQKVKKGKEHQFDNLQTQNWKPANPDITSKFEGGHLELMNNYKLINNDSKVLYFDNNKEFIVIPTVE